MTPPIPSSEIANPPAAPIPASPQSKPLCATTRTLLDGTAAVVGAMEDGSGRGRGSCGSLAPDSSGAPDGEPLALGMYLTWLYGSVAPTGPAGTEEPFAVTSTGLAEAGTAPAPNASAVATVMMMRWCLVIASYPLVSPIARCNRIGGNPGAGQ